MSYQVFARKYRPQTFDDLVGQSHVAQTLKNAVEQNRLAHAYLFVGPRGVGKTSTARILAKALNCLSSDKPTTTPCNKCSNCLEIAGGNNMDVLEIDGASNNKVDEVRVLTDNVRYAPVNSRFKIYIIDEVHMLTSGAFNALLKTLEEPPAHVKFIFATTEPQKVLPTITSRCQRFDLHRISGNLIADHLQFIAKKEKIKLAPAAANSIARGAEGGLRDAESMLDQLVAFCGESIEEPDVLKVFGFTSQQTVARFTEKILNSETADAVQLLHDECEAGKDMMRLMSDLITYLRDLLIYKAKPEALSEEVDAEIQQTLAAQSRLIETDRLLELIDQFAEAEGRMKWAPNKKLHFEVALIKAIQSLNQVTLRQVIENLKALRDGKSEGPRSGSFPAAGSVGSSATGKSPLPAKTPAPARPAARVAERAEIAPKTAPVQGKLDPASLWEAVCARIPAHGFMRNLVDVVSPVGLEGRSFILGYSPGSKSTIDTTATSARLKQLEGYLHDISGQELKLKLEPREGLASPSDNGGGSDEKQYKNDPLIQDALEMFKGQIKS